MDRELEKRWIKLPTIEIDHDESIMTVNGKFLSLPDIAPDTLGDYLQIGHELIWEHFREMKQRYRYWGDSTSRPSILLGRLALTGKEEGVFTEEGLQVANDADIDVDDLEPIFRAHWMTVETALLKPEITRNIMLINHERNGTWLGMSRP